MPIATVTDSFATGSIVAAKLARATLESFDPVLRPLLTGQQYENYLSIRHDRKLPAGKDDSEYRGNAACADGHADFLTRRQSRDPFYYDPTR